MRVSDAAYELGRLFGHIKKLPALLKRSPIAPTRRVWLWLLLIAASLIFAQALRMPASYMTYVFVLILPLGAAAQLILAGLFLRTATRSDSDTVEKHTPFDFVSIASNNCLFPFPFIEAELLTPDERGARCVGRRIGFSLAPYGGCELTRSVEFAFRGVYEVGLKRLYVYDCFRMVRLRIECERTVRVFVLPRRFELTPKRLSAESDRSTRTVVRRKGADNTELSDLRAYIAGDSPKSIHWKLSSKSDEPIVRDYSKNAGSSVYVICDLEPHYKLAPDAQVRRPIGEYADVIDFLCSDMTVEYSLAAALRELRAMNSVTLLWLTEENGKPRPRSCEINAPGDFDAAYRSFAAAPTVDRGSQALLLASLIPETADCRIILVTSSLAAASVAEYARIAAAYRTPGSETVEIIYAADRTLFVRDPAAETIETERLAALTRFAAVTIGSEERSGNPK